jgi:hypothetical protein
MDTPRVLLEHYLKQLRLPTIVREFAKTRVDRITAPWLPPGRMPASKGAARRVATSPAVQKASR